MRISRAPVCIVPLLVVLAACQHVSHKPGYDQLIATQPTSAGGAECAPSDWLERLPLAQRYLLPTNCQAIPQSLQTLFSWGTPPDYLDGTPWTFTLRPLGGAVLASRSDLYEPRLAYNAALQPGNYEWSVSYQSSRGGQMSTQWRRFTVVAGTAPQAIPAGYTVSTAAMAKARPRVLPGNSSYASIAATVRQNSEYLAVLNKLRGLAAYNATRALPAAPATPSNPADLQRIQNDNGIWQTARNERGFIEQLALIGKLEGNAAMVTSAKQRVLNLASWSPTGVTSEAMNIQANREIYLGLAMGLDMLWPEFSSNERTLVTTALRARLLDAVNGLRVLDKAPYDSHGVNDVRWVNQALMLAAGLPGFPEAQDLLAKTWDLGRFTLTTWGEGQDGGFGNGIAYGWYNFVNTVPYVAATRVITGVDLYQIDALRNAGNQLIAFTAPNTKAPSAFGDEAENDNLYGYYAATYYRLHAQLTRNPQDAWYWRANPATLTTPPDGLIWQLLLLGADSRPSVAPAAPTQNSWFFPSAGYAAMHVDARLADRTSVFFRSSPFGAYNHSHADQNAIVYTSKGRPLLMGSGYYPWYNSAHHRTVTRATRFKNTLTFDGGFGQSEVAPLGAQPSAPVQTMDTGGEIIYSDDRGNLSAVTGDATRAYRAVNTSTAALTPLLTNAVRSVVMDRANGVTLVYDWATSTSPRRWELNYHSPNEFSANAVTVTASNGGASACLDRYGAPSSFSQTSAWPVAPEVAKPAQAHGRFTMLAATTELAHLTVIRDSCRTVPIQVHQTDTQIVVSVAGGPAIQFDKRRVTLPGGGTPASASTPLATTSSSPSTSPPPTGSSSTTSQPATSPNGASTASVPSTTLVASAVNTGIVTTRTFASDNWLWGLECNGQVLAANAVPEGGVMGKAYGSQAMVTRFSKITDPLNPNRKVLYFAPTRDDGLLWGAPRCEIGYSPTQAGKLPMGQDFWYGFGLYLPGWQVTADEQIVTQWHTTTGAITAPLNPPFAISVMGNAVRIVGRSGAGASLTKAGVKTVIDVKSNGLPTSGWTYFVIKTRVSFSGNPAPYVQIWRDGVPVVSSNAPIGYDIPGAVLYSKFGHYHWIDASNPWPASVPTRTVLHRPPITVVDKNGAYTERDIRGWLMQQ